MTIPVEKSPEYERITRLLRETKISQRQYVRGLELLTEFRADVESLVTTHAPSSESARAAVRESAEFRTELAEAKSAYDDRAHRNENLRDGHERGWYLSRGEWVLWQPPGN